MLYERKTKIRFKRQVPTRSRCRHAGRTAGSNILHEQLRTAIGADAETVVEAAGAHTIRSVVLSRDRCAKSLVLSTDYVLRHDRPTVLKILVFDGRGF